jgi:hypothetical protein
MNRETAAKVLDWIESRKRQLASMFACLFPEQRRAADDPARLKAFFCTRRAGKSWCIGILLFVTALQHPGSSCLYLGLTRETARGIMNKDIFRVLNERFAIGANWNETQRAWVLPNASVIYLRGADANAYEISKVVGQKYRLAVLDEASKYRHEVRAMVYGALIPAMGDDLGTIILSGTPSNITTGLFFDVTNGNEPGWAVHRWTWRENVYKRAKLEQAHDELVSANPLIVTTPLYQQEWLGRWVVDLSALVYKFSDALNTASELPRPAHEYSYCLGVDLGYKDATAFVVTAYHDNDPALYLVYVRKQRGMIVSQVAEHIRALWHQPSMQCTGPFRFAAMVADAGGLGLQIVEEIRQRHHLPLVPAEKQGKKGVIDVFNSDLQTGRLKVLPTAMSIVEEWGSLIWDEKEKAKYPARWLEDGRFDNHLADAALYAWRTSRNYDAVPAAAPDPAPMTPEWEAQRLQREIARIETTHAQPGGIFLDELPPWLQERGDEP